MALGDGVLDFGKVATIVMKNESNFFACLHGNKNKFLFLYDVYVLMKIFILKKKFGRRTSMGG